MNCPCCGATDIEEGHTSEPYLCTECDYIHDDVGEYYCKTCQIHMEKNPAWNHSYMEGHHDIIRP